MIKNILTIILNGGIVLAAWLAVSGSVPCGYITKFLAVVTVVLSPGVVISLANPNPRAPNLLSEWASHITDALLVSILVWHGWLWCAGAFAWGWLGCVVVFAARKLHHKKTLGKN